MGLLMADLSWKKIFNYECDRPPAWTDSMSIPELTHDDSILHCVVKRSRIGMWIPLARWSRKPYSISGLRFPMASLADWLRKPVLMVWKNRTNFCLWRSFHDLWETQVMTKNDVDFNFHVSIETSKIICLLVMTEESRKPRSRYLEAYVDPRSPKTWSAFSDLYQWWRGWHQGELLIHEQVSIVIDFPDATIGNERTSV